MVNKDENGNDLSDTVSFQIKGTMTVDGNMVTDATVFSDESLHVTGTMSGDLTIGDAKNVGYAEIGTITGDVVVANGELYVTEELDTSSVKASEEGTIEFASDATIGTTAGSLFKDSTGEPVSNVGGLTFTGTGTPENAAKQEGGVKTEATLNLEILVNAKKYREYTGAWANRYPDSVAVDGNNVTITTKNIQVQNDEGKWESDTERGSMMDYVARFLGALYRANVDEKDGPAVTEIVYNGTTFVWNGDKAGSNWVEDVTGETKAKTLIYCLYGSTGEEDGEVPVDNPTSIPLTVNGQEINITVKYPVGTAESGS